jgi:methionyl-tRNA synthetase
VLCANAPEAKDNDFTWKDFQARNNNELLAILGNFVNRAWYLLKKYYEGGIPALGKLEEADKEVLDSFAIIKKEIENNLDNFRFREALKSAMNLARIGNKYLADTEPWKLIKTEPERVKTILNIALQLTANLSIVMTPFIPFTAKKLTEFLNIEELDWESAGEKELLKAGHKINKPELLFRKIEDEEIEAQVQRLLDNKKANEEVSGSLDPMKEQVSFDDFTKMDIRVATILEAEKVPKTKKLMKLLVDTGLDKRTIVSGIAEFFEAEKLVGQKVCVLLNLAPRAIKGIESNGMILLSENKDGSLYFVEPDEKAQNGMPIN